MTGKRPGQRLRTRLPLDERAEQRVGPFRPVGIAAFGQKRHRGRQRWIMPMAVGTVVEVDDLSESELELALATISAVDGKGAKAA